VCTQNLGSRLTYCFFGFTLKSIKREFVSVKSNFGLSSYVWLSILA